MQPGVAARRLSDFLADYNLHSGLLYSFHHLVSHEGVAMDRFKPLFRVANSVALFLIAGALFVKHSQAAPATTTPAAITSNAFSYEGRLGTLSGRYDFQFRLFADTSSATPVVATVVAVSNVLVD